MRDCIVNIACLLAGAELLVAASPIFKSSNVTASMLQIHPSDRSSRSDLLVIDPEQIQPSAMILKDDGDLVWCGPEEKSTRPTIQSLHGRRVLARWVGHTVAGLGYGAVKILDQSYMEIHSVCPKLGLYAPKASQGPRCEADGHDLKVSDRNTLIVTANNVTQADLTSVGGPTNGWIIDGQFHDLDLETGKPVFSWSAAEHVSVNKTRNVLNGTGSAPSVAFDYFHINSVHPLPGGRYLVDGRHTSAMYLIGTAGNIEWEFNGYDGGDFVLPDDANFAFKHNVGAKWAGLYSIDAYLQHYGSPPHSQSSDADFGHITRRDNKWRSHDGLPPYSWSPETDFDSASEATRRDEETNKWRSHDRLPPYSWNPGTDSDSVSDAARRDEGTNEWRSHNGLPPYSWNPGADSDSASYVARRGNKWRTHYGKAPLNWNGGGGGDNTDALYGSSSGETSQARGTSDATRRDNKWRTHYGKPPLSWSGGGDDTDASGGSSAGSSSEESSQTRSTGGSWIVQFFNIDNSQGHQSLAGRTGFIFHLDASTKIATLLRKTSDPKDNFLFDYSPELTLKDVTSNESYRAFRSEWSGTPYYPPSLYVDSAAREVYVSWNGATDVKRYRLYGGKTKYSLRPIGYFPKTGFETRFALPSDSNDDKYFQISAIRGTKPLRRSAIVTVS